LSGTSILMIVEYSW